MLCSLSNAFFKLPKIPPHVSINTFFLAICRRFSKIDIWNHIYSLTPTLTCSHITTNTDELFLLRLGVPLTLSTIAEVEHGSVFPPPSTAADWQIPSKCLIICLFQQTQCNYKINHLMLPPFTHTYTFSRPTLICRSMQSLLGSPRSCNRPCPSTGLNVTVTPASPLKWESPDWALFNDFVKQSDLPFRAHGSSALADF